MYFQSVIANKTKNKEITSILFTLNTYFTLTVFKSKTFKRIKKIVLNNLSRGQSINIISDIIFNIACSLADSLWKLNLAKVCKISELYTHFSQYMYDV